MDFEFTARTADLAARLETFMAEHVLPAEAVYDAQVAANANPPTSSRRSCATCSGWRASRACGTSS